MFLSISAFFEFIGARREEIFIQTFQHLYLSLTALFLAIAIGVCIGILLSRYRRLSTSIIGFLGVIQTIPSLALLGFTLPLLGIGALPAIFALFLYALLPIVRNTYTGITEVDQKVIEAARGMGMTVTQVLVRVELPLAIPIIFSGIRTAATINVGIATLCSLIGAGGLGEFIFSGISLVNSYMTLAGAIPAALLALLLDGILALVQKNIQKIIRPVLIVFGALALFLVAYTLGDFAGSEARITAGFDREFSERADGYPALMEVYGLNFESIKSLDSGLMYEALKAQEVDVISGYSTEGKIESYQLRVLEDDAHGFPPYFVAPCVNQATLRKYPELNAIFDRIANQIPDSTMRRLNLAVDQDKKSPIEVAKGFLKSKGLKVAEARRGKADILIGGKNFTEQYILLEMFKLLIENYSDLTVEVKRGMGGTQILFDALKQGDIDIYPEYTGTAFLVILKPGEKKKAAIIQDSEAVYNYVKKTSEQEYGVTWLPPLGFNNTYALMMREQQAQSLKIRSISDLTEFLNATE